MRPNGAFRRLRPFPGALTAAWVCASAPGVSAQDFDPVPIRGRVLEESTDRPVAGAAVRFAPGRPSTVTDSAGRFVLDLPPDGRYPIRVEQFGYETALVVLPSTAPLEVSTVYLSVAPLELQGISVTVDRFAERRRRAFRSSTVLDAARLAGALGGTFDVVSRSVVGGRPCPTDPFSICKMRRGSLRTVSVCIDDQVAYRPKEELDRLEPADLYQVEVFDDTLPFQVRVYTRPFVARLTSGEAWLRPWQWGCSG